MVEIEPWISTSRSPSGSSPVSPIRASTSAVGACGTASVAPATSCADCAMNSRSTSPPGASFRSNGCRGGRSLRHQRSRIETTSSMVFARIARPRRGSPRSPHRPGSPSPSSATTTRARLSARCSQVQALSLVIADEGRQARRQRPGIAGRPQPHVGLVEHALGGRRGHRRHQPLRQPREVVARRQRLLAVGLLRARRRS